MLKRGFLIAACIGCLLFLSSWAVAAGRASLSHFQGHQVGILAKATSYVGPSSADAAAHPMSAGSPSLGTHASFGSGPRFVVSETALHCLTQTGTGPSLGPKSTLAGLQCLSMPIPPAIKAAAKKPGKRPKAPPPPPAVLAELAVDRAIALAGKPEFQIAPSRVGLTGLDSYFWIAPAPRPIAAQAAVPGLVVTARARPVQYVWRFGDGSEQVTSTPGRPWTPDRPGNIAHQYQTRDRYTVSVQVIWNATWRVGRGVWRGLGTFATTAERSYPVRQAIAVLVKS
jgi:hypothetical protein